MKPQFEAGPADVGKGGVVRDPEVHRRVLRETVHALRRGAHARAVVDSGLPGPKGNREFFLYLTDEPGETEVDDAGIEAAVG